MTGLHRRHRRARGFTLLEISTVLAVIGILTATAVVGGRLFTERSRSSALVTELDHLWEDVRGAATGQGTGARAVLEDAVAAANRRSGYTFQIIRVDGTGNYADVSVTDASAGTDPLTGTHVRVLALDVDGLPCAVMAIPADATVERAAIGPCHAPGDAIDALKPGGWWTLDDQTGSVTASAEYGERGTANGITFAEPPAMAGAYDPDIGGPTPDGFTGITVPGAIRTGSGAASVGTAGRITTTDTTGWTDPTGGLTAAVFARYPSGNPGTGTVMQIGGAGQELLTLEFATDVPTCVLGDPAAATPITAIPDDAGPGFRTWAALVDEPTDWHLIACRYDPTDQTVALVIDGNEVARSAQPDIDAHLGDLVSTWADPSTGAITVPLPVDVWPIGGPGSTAAGSYDEPAIHGAALSNGTLAGLYRLSRVPACPVTGCP